MENEIQTMQQKLEAYQKAKEAYEKALNDANRELYLVENRINELLKEIEELFGTTDPQKIKEILEQDKKDIEDLEKKLKELTEGQNE